MRNSPNNPNNSYNPNSHNIPNKPNIRNNPITSISLNFHINPKKCKEVEKP